MILFEISDVADYIVNIKDTFVSLYDYIVSLFSIFPEPFKSMIIIGATISTAWLLIKILRG